MALPGIWTPAAEFAFHIEYHYTTDPRKFVDSSLLKKCYRYKDNIKRSSEKWILLNFYIVVVMVYFGSYYS